MNKISLGILLFCIFLMASPISAQQLSQSETKMSTMLKKKFQSFKSEALQKKYTPSEYKRHYGSKAFPIDRSGRIFLYLTVMRNIDAVASTITSWGGEIHNKSNYDLYAWIPMDKLESLAGLDGLTFMDASGQSSPRIEPVISAGYYQLLADSAIKYFYTNGAEINGNPVNVGVISNGIQYYPNSQNKNELPPVNFTWVNYNGVDGRSFIGSEGTAMAELIYDLAPGASLYFGGTGRYTNYDGDTLQTTPIDMANIINTLSSSSLCKIIVDDVGWPYNYPFFEDGDISQAIATFQSNGGIYVSAAGNDADRLYAGKPSVKTGVQKNWLLFNRNDTSLTFNISNYYDCLISLQWDNAWYNSSDDYDLYLYDSNWRLIESSTTSQTGMGSHPQEWLFFSPGNLSNSTFHIMINYKNYTIGREFRNIKVLVDPRNEANSSASFSFSSKSSQGHIYGHSAAPNVISVAAYDASNPNKIEYYSSRGPSVMFPLGNPGGEVERKTPVITATDNVETRVGKDGFFGNPFTGTSAAAPHAAAIAALYFSRFPGQTASQFISAITTSAKSIDGGTGGVHNTTSGYGKISAYDALIKGLTVLSSPHVSTNTYWDMVNIQGTATIDAGKTVTINAKNTTQIDGTVNLGDGNSKLIVYGTLILTNNAKVIPSSGIEVRGPNGRIIGPNLIAVNVDQKDQDNNSFGKVGRWLFTQFDTSNTAPYTFYTFDKTPERMKGQQYFKPGTTQKFWLWNSNASKAINPDTFNIVKGRPNRITSQFRSTFSAKLQAQLLEGGAPGDTLFFLDPWLIDFTDAYGSRNQGTSALFKPVVYNSQIPNNLGQGTTHMGVFGGMAIISGRPYYSVKAPLKKNNFNGTTGYFQYWTTSNATLQQTGANPDGFDQKAAVFNGDLASITANYKGSMRSNTAAAFSNSSQRKFIRTSEGYLHLVYESMGRVWYEMSTDNGSSWGIMNGGKPLSSNPSKLPSIASYGSAVAIVWQEENSSHLSDIRIKSFYDYSGSYIPGPIDGVVSTDQQSYSTDHNPSVAWGSSGRILVVWSREGEMEGLRYRYGGSNGINLGWMSEGYIPGSSGDSKHVAVSADLTSSYFHFAWEEGVNQYTSIIYQKLHFDNNGNLDMISEPVNVSAPISSMRTHTLQLYRSREAEPG